MSRNTPLPGPEKRLCSPVDNFIFTRRKTENVLHASGSLAPTVLQPVELESQTALIIAEAVAVWLASLRSTINHGDRSLLIIPAGYAG